MTSAVFAVLLVLDAGAARQADDTEPVSPGNPAETRQSPTPAASAQALDEELVYDEEMTVTAETLEKGQVPTAEIMSATYNDRARGWRLYQEGKYKEALPYLVRSAKRGLKWPQALAGDILLHGRGGVPRNVPMAIGWLGTAASPTAEPAMVNYYKGAMDQVPEEYVDWLDDVVELFREEYGSRGRRVSCVRSTNRPNGGYIGSLRFRRVECSFMDEVPVCRNPYALVNPTGSSDTLATSWRDERSDQSMEWLCPVLRDR